MFVDFLIQSGSEVRVTPEAIRQFSKEWAKTQEDTLEKMTPYFLYSGMVGYSLEIAEQAICVLYELEGLSEDEISLFRDILIALVEKVQMYQADNGITPDRIFALDELSDFEQLLDADYFAAIGQGVVDDWRSDFLQYITPIMQDRSYKNSAECHLGLLGLASGLSRVAFEFLAEALSPALDCYEELQEFAEQFENEWFDCVRQIGEGRDKEWFERRKNEKQEN